MPSLKELLNQIPCYPELASFGITHHYRNPFHHCYLQNIMADDTFFYSNCYADYYCADVPKLGVCPICECFGPDSRH